LQQLFGYFSGVIDYVSWNCSHIIHNIWHKLRRK
jgi:hypothetical protein